MKMRNAAGQVIDIDDADSRYYQSLGYTPESDEQTYARIKTEAEKPEDRGIIGTINAGATSLLSGATLGLSDIALSGMLDDDQRKRLAFERDSHPVVSGIGQVAGAIAPALASPVSALGRMPSGLLSHKLAGVAAQGRAVGGATKVGATLGTAAAEGAVQNAGMYLSETALHDRELSAEALAGALGAGFGFGVAGGAAVLGIEGGTIAARRLFSRAQGTERAAADAQAAWQTQYQANLEAHQATADIAKAKLAEAQTAREQAQLAKMRAGIAADQAKRNAPAIDQTRQSAEATKGMLRSEALEANAAGPAAFAQYPDDLRARMTALGWGDDQIAKLEAARSPGGPAAQLDPQMRASLHDLGFTDAEIAAMPPAQLAEATGFAARANEQIPTLSPAKEADLAQAVAEHDSALAELEAVLKRIEAPDIGPGVAPPSRDVPIGEFGAPGMRGYDPGNVKAPGPPSVVDAATGDVTAVGKRKLAEGTPTDAPSLEAQVDDLLPATDTLTGQLRGMQSKLGAGEDLKAMGAPARAEYAADKAERTREAAEHFRAKATASNTDSFFENLTKPKSRDEFVARNIGAAMKSEGSHAAGLAKLEREWAEITKDSAKRLSAEAKAAAISDDEFKALQSEYASKLTPSEDKALDVYVSSTYKDLNRALRHSEIRNGRERFLTDVDAALAKASLPRRTTLYRGLSGEEAKQFAKLEPGDSFVERAYSSTSSNPEAFKREVNLHIDAPEGYQAAPIPSNIDEKEFLLRRGTRYEVTGVAEDGSAKTISVRIVDSEPPTPLADMVSNKIGRQSDAPPLEIVKASAGAYRTSAAPTTPFNFEQSGLRFDSKTRTYHSPNGVEVVAIAAEVVTKYERATARLVEALGPDAPPAARQAAKAFREAETEAERRMMDRTTRAIDDQVEAKPEPRKGARTAAPSPSPAPDLAEFDRVLGGLPLPPTAAETLGAAKAAKADTGLAFKQAKLAETEARFGAKRADKALQQARGVEVPGSTAEPEMSKLGAAAVAFGVAGEVGVPGVPRPSDLPIIGPLLGLYLKYRAVKAAAGRFIGRIPATGDARAAALVTRTKDKIATAVDRTLGLVAETAPKLRQPTVAAATVLGHRIFDDGEPDAPKGASTQELAAVRVREIANAVSQPQKVAALVRREMRGVIDPDLIAAAEQHLIKRFEYLNSVAPKQPAPNPYTMKKWVPSPAAAHDLAQRIEVVNDPEAAFVNTTPAKAETLKAVSPRLLQLAQERLLARIGDIKNPVPYKQRLRASHLFGVQLDDSLDPQAVSLVQGAFATTRAEPAPTPMAPPTSSVAAPTNLTDMYQTGMDRRAMR